MISVKEKNRKLSKGKQKRIETQRIDILSVQYVTSIMNCIQ